MLAVFQRQPLLAVLAVAAVLLFVAIGLETGFGARLAPAIPTAATKSAAAFEAKLLPALAAASPEASYPEMTARPLFVPARRPSPPAEVAAQSNFKRGQFVLQGVTIVGDTRIAMLREKSNGHVHRVEKGGDLNGVKVAEISPESVTLAQGAEQEVLPLQVQKTAPGAAAPALPGPFGPSGPTPPQSHPAPGNVPFTPPQAPPPPGAANPAAAAVPQATTAPMTPEELLARRRSRRAQQTE